MSAGMRGRGLNGRGAHLERHRRVAGVLAKAALMVAIATGVGGCALMASADARSNQQVLTSYARDRDSYVFVVGLNAGTERVSPDGRFVAQISENDDPSGVYRGIVTVTDLRGVTVVEQECDCRYLQWDGNDRLLAVGSITERASDVEFLATRDFSGRWQVYGGRSL